MRSILMLPILTIALLVLLTGPSLDGLGADSASAQVARVAVMPTAESVKEFSSMDGGNIYCCMSAAPGF